MILLQRLLAHLISGAECPPGLVPFLGTRPGQDFVIKLAELDGVLSSHVLESILPSDLAPVCSVCGEPQFETPSGMTCKNGHGGADPKPELELTESQETAVALISDWLNDSSSSRYFCVRGFAGSGKTFLLRHLKTVFQSFPSISTVLYATPTHKAANVLSSSAEVSVSTLASLLGVKVSDDSEELVYELPESLPDIPRNCLIVVDEASMISKDYLGFINTVAETYGIRVIFFGDPAQLPPPGEHRSPVWRFVPPSHQTVLTNVKRHCGDLLDLVTHVRSFVFNKELRTTDVFQDRNSDNIHLVSVLSRSIRLNLDSFRDGSSKVIAWRNSRVDALAESIRADLGFQYPYSIGERYNLRRPVVTTSGSVVGVAEDEIVIENQYMDREFESDGFRLPCYVLTVSGAFAATFRVIDPDKDFLLEEALSKLARKARNSKGYERKAGWRTFWKMKNSFAHLKSAYSLTAHRSQGSQFNTVYVDSVDILSNPRKSEAFRCLYVALTRASKSLVIRT